MRAVIQRVANASVIIDSKEKATIGLGLLVFLGIEDADNDEDIEWLCGKIIRLRIFNDSNGLMNLSLKEVNGEILVISQFTLHASTKKGNRPSFIRASKPTISEKVYNKFVSQMRYNFRGQVKTGEFGADMKVNLLNDGPVTIFIDTKNKE
jgi:D-tyrosyl-tRNA(Tyr) deacylase